MSDFTGFPKQTLTFLRGLRRNNSKAWFPCLASSSSIGSTTMSGGRSSGDAGSTRAVLVLLSVWRFESVTSVCTITSRSIGNSASGTFAVTVNSSR